ncbi:hypothetical protein HPB48_018517 [Haemaphysalis longicornis]|uniref:Uncharacterized protein n=1 Tax=Haemaphysalis longicornis TaxID=44386 RepID=A0A9J6GIZ7_HAELO|nr:hypothetical protein HPB48_018517 [Haemaphysalis longicornis]
MAEQARRQTKADSDAGEVTRSPGQPRSVPDLHTKAAAFLIGLPQASPGNPRAGDSYLSAVPFGQCRRGSLPADHVALPSSAVWFQNRRSKERRMKQLSTLGARRHFFRSPRRVMRSLRPGMSPDGLDDSPDIGPPSSAFGYFSGAYARCLPSRWASESRRAEPKTNSPSDGRHNSGAERQVATKA